MLGGGGQGGGGGFDLGSLFGGGGGGGGMGGLLNLIGGGIDAHQQGKAADGMKNYINGNLDYIKGLYAPGSPEHNLMKQEMERKDAAAGRNSQYGPRATDLAAKITGIKGDLISRYVPGTARSLADAYATDAGRYAGLSSALGRSLGGGSGGSTLPDLFGGGGLGGIPGNPFFNDLFGGGGDVQFPTDSWYTNPDQWTDTDVLDWLGSSGGDAFDWSDVWMDF